MDRDFIYRQTLVWLEHQEIGSRWHARPWLEWPDLAETLTNHLWNNWEMVERAKTVKRIDEMLFTDS